MGACASIPSSGRLSAHEKAHIPHHFDSNWVLVKKIGTGGSAEVWMATHKFNRSDVCAVKVFRNHSESDEIKNEVQIMRRLSGHPQIPNYMDVYFEEEAVYLCLEYLDGGCLFDRLMRGAYSEANARDSIFLLLSTLHYIHDHGVVHRDLKLENILLTTTGEVKLADFGLAATIDGTGQKLRKVCGTVNYLAPEVIRDAGYDFAVDMWSLGIVSYILLSGQPPFYSATPNNNQEMFRTILRAEYDTDTPPYTSVTRSARDFVASLLNPDPDKRLTSEQALKHEWMSAARDTLVGRNLTEAVKRYKAFQAKTKLKGAIRGVMATNRFKQVLCSAKKEASSDKEGDPSIDTICTELIQIEEKPE